MFKKDKLGLEQIDNLGNGSLLYHRVLEKHGLLS